MRQQRVDIGLAGCFQRGFPHAGKRNATNPIEDEIKNLLVVF
jgi:hypothetical protein